MAEHNNTNADTLQIRRLQKEAMLMRYDTEDSFQAYSLETDMRTIYFLLRPKDEPFAGGLYIGTIIAPPEYPIKPCDFKMMTPSGRFIINQKICMTNSSYHSGEWSPTWTFTGMVIGVLSIMYGDDHGISMITKGGSSDKERKQYAKESIKYNIDTHPEIFKRFDKFVNPDFTIKTDAEIRQFIENLKKEEKQAKQLVKSLSNSTDSKNSETTKSDLFTNSITINPPKPPKSDKKPIELTPIDNIFNNPTESDKKKIELTPIDNIFSNTLSVNTNAKLTKPIEESKQVKLSLKDTDKQTADTTIKIVKNTKEPHKTKKNKKNEEK